MAYFLKKAKLKGRTYLSIVESYYSHEKRGAAHRTGSLTVVSNFLLTKSLKTLIISMLLSFFIVKFVKINVLIWANVCYNRHRR